MSESPKRSDGKKQFLAAVFVFAALVLAGRAIVREGDSQLMQNAMSLRLQMSQSEVVQVLGSPRDRFCMYNGGDTVMHYGDPAGQRTAFAAMVESLTDAPLIEFAARPVVLRFSTDDRLILIRRGSKILQAPELAQFD